MYQTLIRAAVPGNETRGLGTSLDSEDMKRSTDALVDCMRRNIQLCGDLFRRQMLVDEAQAVELARAQPSNPVRILQIDPGRITRSRACVGHPSYLQTHPSR